MKCMAVECSSDAVEGELFCHAHIRMTAEVDPMECPRGCGPMAYKQDRWNVGLWILGSFVAFLLLIEMFVLAVLVSISIMTWGDGNIRRMQATDSAVLDVKEYCWIIRRYLG